MKLMAEATADAASPPSAQYRMTARVTTAADGPGVGEIGALVERLGGTLRAGVVERETADGRVLRLTADGAGEGFGAALAAALEARAGIVVLGLVDETFALHAGGKIAARSRAPLAGADELAMAYTPGVARVCNAIAGDRRRAYELTIKANTVAVVTDGTAVLGLGDIGPEAALPVMEGKAMLFEQLAGVDAFPICLGTTDPDEIVAAVRAIAPGFAGVNLEDIAAPRCFEIERRLQEALDVPVFHDDQHGTAVVVLAALMNACRVVGKPLERLRVVVSGAGASGLATTRMLLAAGVADLVVCDSRGAIGTGREDYRDGSMPPDKRRCAEATNPRGVSGRAGELLEGADLLVGLSGARLVEADALAAMAGDAIVFALANPTPEVDPAAAARHARVVATGRSDFPNQINNVLAFPGIFRGALDVRASRITEAMKLAAAEAIAACVPPGELGERRIVPAALDPAVAPAVAAAVARRARIDGVATSEPAADAPAADVPAALRRPDGQRPGDLSPNWPMRPAGAPG